LRSIHSIRELTAGLLHPCLLTASAVSSLAPQEAVHVQVLEQSMTLTKIQIVEELFAKNGLSKRESAQVIDTMIRGPTDTSDQLF
jgi:hypothetical protein